MATVTNYEYDEENNLTAISLPDGSREEYSYSANGLRQNKKITSASGQNSISNFLWDGPNLLAEQDANNNGRAYFTNMPPESDRPGKLISERRINQPQPRAAQFNNQPFGAAAFNSSRTPLGDQSFFYGFDMSANTRTLTDLQGNVTDKFVHTVFGELVSHEGANETPLGFGGEVGYYRDKLESVYIRARHYAPDTGRWLTRDPIGFDGGNWNLYVYVDNNPVNKVDPSGLGRIPSWLLSGQLKFNGCTPGFVNSYFCVLDEDGKFVHNPGNGTQGVDGIAFGNGAILKVPSNCSLTITCSAGQISDLSCDCISLLKNRCRWISPNSPQVDRDYFFGRLRGKTGNCQKPFPPVSDCISSFLGRPLPTVPTPRSAPTRSY